MRLGWLVLPRLASYSDVEDRKTRELLTIQGTRLDQYFQWSYIHHEFRTLGMGNTNHPLHYASCSTVTGELRHL